MLRLRLLTFDLINTLVKVRGTPAHQYAEVALTVGVNVKEADIARVYQSTRSQMVSILIYFIFCIYFIIYIFWQ